jgi:hypothetical protein
MSKILNAVALCAWAMMLPAVAGVEAGQGESGVKLVPPAANTGAVVPSEQASTVREVKRTEGQTLRCWQHGRLLYEEKGFKYSAEKKPNAVVVPKENGDSVVVFDQKDSICILSKK